MVATVSPLMVRVTVAPGSQPEPWKLALPPVVTPPGVTVNSPYWAAAGAANTATSIRAPMRTLRIICCLPSGTESPPRVRVHGTLLGHGPWRHHFRKLDVGRSGQPTCADAVIGS